MRNQPSTQSSARRVNLGELVLPSRRQPVVRAIAAQWRRLTSPPHAGRNGPGAPTLIACSGGGDSSALAIALAAAAGRNASTWLTVAHVVHDMRPASQALADRDCAARLAERLGLAFVDVKISIRGKPGNAEGLARKARYQSLASLARERGARFVATAHNSHDQVESVLMALLRGAGPRGLAAIAETRPLAGGLRVIRPMLTVSPVEARELCDGAGWTYAVDATNEDTSRLRSAIRHRVVPQLLALRPAAPRRIASAADRCREAAEVIDRRARVVVKRATTAGNLQLERRAARRLPSAILGEALRQAAAAIAGGQVLDRLPARTVTAAARLIRSGDTDPRELAWPGVAVFVDAHRVLVRAAATS